MDAGQLLNSRYRLAERLGAGGMSVVWRAHDEVLGREVAVKVLAGQFAEDPAWRRRIRLEAQAAARLSHPNITNVYDYGETADRHPFVVMELLRGPTLAKRLESGPLPPAAAIRICAEVAAGLAAAHAEDLVHRDVKPANVVLTADAAKVVDFGIVGFAGDPGDPDPAAPVLGTPAYLAPERLCADEVTPASDVYAFGLLLYRSLTGRLPWDNETTTQMVLAHITVEPEPLPQIPGVAPEVRLLCMRCLAKDPADRPAAVEVASALAQAAGIVPRFSAVPAVPPTPAAGSPADASTELVAAETAKTAETADTADPGETADPADEADDRGDRRRVLLGLAVVLAVAALLVTFVLSRPMNTPQASAEAAKPAPTVTGTSQQGDPVPTGTEAAATATPAPASGTEAPGAANAKPVAGGQPTGGGDPGNQGGGQPGNPGDPGNTPGNPGNTPGGPPPTTAPPAGIHLPTLGGVIVAVCVGKKVNVLQVLPAADSKVVKVEQGVRDKARVEFDKAGVRVRFQVTCAAGAPVATPA